MSDSLKINGKTKKLSKGEIVNDTLVVETPERPPFSVASPKPSIIEVTEKKEVLCLDYTKVFMDSSERLNDRRERTNQFYWVMSGVILSGEFFTAKAIFELNNIEIAVVLFVLLFSIASIGLAITQNWTNVIKNYAKVSLAKVVIVQGIESQQAAKHFTSQSQILDQLDYVAHTTLEQRNPEIIERVHQCIQCLCGIGFVLLCIYLFLLQHGYINAINCHEIINRQSVHDQSL